MRLGITSLVFFRMSVSLSVFLHSIKTIHQHKNKFYELGRHYKGIHKAEHQAWRSSQIGNKSTPHGWSVHRLSIT